MEYKVIETTDAEWLVKQVNEHIADGWQPLGGVNVAAYLASPDDYDPTLWWAQAMIKDEDEDNGDNKSRFGYGSSPGGNRGPRW